MPIKRSWVRYKIAMFLRYERLMPNKAICERLGLREHGLDTLIHRCKKAA